MTRVIVATRYHTCAEMDDLILMCWGYNAYGQGGGGSNTSPVTTPWRLVGSQRSCLVGTTPPCGCCDAAMTKMGIVTRECAA